MRQSPEPETVDGAVNLSNCSSTFCSALLRPLRRRGLLVGDIGKASSLAEAMPPLASRYAEDVVGPTPRPTFQ